jgi:hypothetical protein
MSLQDSMVVTDQRVLFLWRRWLCGMSLVSMEESFYLDDLQVIYMIQIPAITPGGTCTGIYIGYWNLTAGLVVILIAFTPDLRD